MRFSASTIFSLIAVLLSTSFVIAGPLNKNSGGLASVMPKIAPVIRNQCELVYDEVLDLARRDENLRSRLSLISRALQELLEPTNPASNLPLIERYALRANETILQTIDWVQNNAHHGPFSPWEVERLFTALARPGLEELRTRMLDEINSRIDSISYRELLSTDTLALVHPLDLPLFRSNEYAERVANHLALGQKPLPSGTEYPGKPTESPLSPRLALIRQFMILLERTIPQSAQFKESLLKIEPFSEQQRVEAEERSIRYRKALEALTASSYPVGTFIELFKSTIAEYINSGNDTQFVSGLLPKETRALLNVLGLTDLAAKFEDKFAKSVPSPFLADNKKFSGDPANDEERRYREAVSEFTRALGEASSPDAIGSLKPLLQEANRLPSKQDIKSFSVTYSLEEAHRDLCSVAISRGAGLVASLSDTNLYELIGILDDFVDAASFPLADQEEIYHRFFDYIENVYQKAVTLAQKGSINGTLKPESVNVLQAALQQNFDRTLEAVSKALQVQVRFGDSSAKQDNKNENRRTLREPYWNYLSELSIETLLRLQKAAAPVVGEASDRAAEQFKKSVEAVHVDAKKDLTWSDIDFAFGSALTFIAERSLAESPAGSETEKEKLVDRFFRTIGNLSSAPELLRRRYQTATCRAVQTKAKAGSEKPKPKGMAPATKS